MNKSPLPWTYVPAGDYDGFVLGTDHFVLDAAGNEVCVAPDERSGHRIAAVNELYDACKGLMKLWEDVSPDAVGEELLTSLDIATRAMRKADGIGWRHPQQDGMDD